MLLSPFVPSFDFTSESTEGEEKKSIAIDFLGRQEKAVGIQGEEPGGRDRDGEVLAEWREPLKCIHTCWHS